MSDSNQKPGPPPDDFSETVPNIKVPGGSGASGGGDDWSKTNYNYPKQPTADEWGKTVANIKPIDIDNDDFGKTMHPGSRKAPEVDWGATQANIRVPDTDFGGGRGDEGYGKTTPYFQLPDDLRQKYEQVPPTPGEVAAEEQAVAKAQGGIPGWVWAAAGMLAMFMFAVVVLVGVLLWNYAGSNYDAVVRNPPIGADIFVDGVLWGVEQPDGSRLLQNLRPGGDRTITIVHPAFECEPGTVNSSKREVVARCRQAAVKPGEDCSRIGLGEEDKAERCYNAALDGLPDPFTAEQLKNALNILIINFESGKFDIPAKRMEALKKGAGFIQKLPPSVVLEVGGHTDNVGSDASNQTLSDNRAKAVKDALVTFGVRPEALQTKGYGPTRPKTTNDTDLGKFYNRRIEYSVVRQ